MQLSYFFKAASWSALEELTNILRNPKAHFQV
jgi:hypothetical protein